MRIKDNKGSITIFVLVGLLFMSAFLLISYAHNVNKSKVAQEQFNFISKIYSPNKSDEESYTDAYTDLRKKNKQTLTSSSEDSNVLELTKTFESNMENLIIYGNSVQDGTPSPETPIEIESVGDKTKNLFNKNTVTIGYGTSTEDGGLYADENYLSSDYIPVEAGKTYSLNWNTVKWICFYDENKQYISFNKNSVYEITNTGYVRFTAMKEELDTLQFEEGNTVTDYEPYGYKIPIEVSARNVVNREDDTKTGAGKTVPFEYSYPNTGAGTYTFSCEVEVNNYEGNNAMLAYGYKDIDGTITYGTFLKFDSYSQHSSEKGYRYSFSFTVEEKLTFFYVYIHTNCTGGEVTLKNQMLTLNNTDLTYEPYVEPITTNIYLDEPLRKTNDVVDSINFSSGIVSSQINEVTFDGSDDEKWSLNTVLTGVNRFALTIADSEKSNNNRVNNQCKCNYFDTTTTIEFGNANYIKNFVYIYNSVVYFYTDPAQFPDIATWKNWLKENNVILQYKTANVTNTTISIPELETFEDYTKIEVLTEIVPSKIEATYEGYTLE